MLRFLSPEWVAAFGEAVSPIEVPETGADAGLAVRHGEFATCVMARTESGDTVSVTLTVAGGRLTARAGAARDAAVTVRVGWNDAIAFMAGTWAPTTGLAGGRAQVRGDLCVLRATGLALEAVQPYLFALREDTGY